MKHNRLVKTAIILLVFVVVCVIATGVNVQALAQDDKAAPLGLNETDHSSYLGVFPRSALAPYAVQPSGEDVPFSSLPQQIPELNICVSAWEISIATNANINDPFQFWHSEEDEDDDWPRWLDPIVKLLDALFEQLFGLRPFETYVLKFDGWPKEPLDLWLPFGLRFRLPAVPSEAEL